LCCAFEFGDKAGHIEDIMRTFEALLVVADISGYTKFVVMNKSSIIHAEQIITELMEAITKNIEVPLTVQKLEGDAIFMFAEIGADRHKMINEVTKQVVVLMQSYQAKQVNLFQNSVGGCICSACQSIENLNLKCAIHVGEVLEKQVEGRTELAGEPVIMVHRLMKNSIDSDSYMLTTEAVSKELNFAPFSKQKSYKELVTDIGTTPVEVYFSQDTDLDRSKAKPYGWAKRKLEGLRLLFRWILGGLRKGRSNFYNMPS
jgi:exosortase/archaeosortase